MSLGFMNKIDTDVTVASLDPLILKWHEWSNALISITATSIMLHIRAVCHSFNLPPVCSILEIKGTLFPQL